MPKAKRRSTAEEAKNITKKKKGDNTVVTNAVFANTDRTFKVCCIKAKVPASKRQAGKFRGDSARGINPHGAAFEQLLDLSDEDFALLDG